MRIILFFVLYCICSSSFAANSSEKSCDLARCIGARLYKTLDYCHLDKLWQVDSENRVHLRALPSSEIDHELFNTMIADCANSQECKNEIAEKKIRAERHEEGLKNGWGQPKQDSRVELISLEKDNKNNIKTRFWIPSWLGGTCSCRMRDANNAQQLSFGTTTCEFDGSHEFLRCTTRF